MIPPLLIGLVSGWLVNYLSGTLPYWRALIPPRCPNCEAAQPLLNYFLWPRRCPGCGWTHRARSFAVDVFMIAASLWLWSFHPASLGYGVSLVLLSFLSLVVIIDLEHRLILHPVSLFGVGLGVLVGSWLHGPTSTVLGGAVGFSIMFAFYALGGLFTRQIARMRGEPVDEVALGFGDVNLAGVLGLLLGYPNILAGLLLAILAGGAISLVYLLVSLIARKYKMLVALPYAPYLVFGAGLLIYFPETARSLLTNLFPLLALLYQ